MKILIRAILVFLFSVNLASAQYLSGPTASFYRGFFAPTQPTLTGNNSIADTAFVNAELIRSKATQQVPVTGGTYNTASTGSGLQVVVLTSAGSVTSILTMINGGTGYLNGDILRLSGGNIDSIVRVTNEIGGVVQTGGLQIVYGGSGYSNGVQLGVMLPPVVGNETVVYSGALSSNVTIIQPAGTYLNASRQVVYVNDTTGPYTLTVFLSNGSGGTIGNGLLIPQGTNHSCDVFGETDGETDIWYAAPPVCDVAPNYFSGTSASIGGSLLAAGGCSTGTVSITGATTAMGVVVTPVADPGNGIWWSGYVSSAGTVTVKVCSAIAATPAAETYNVRVLQ